MGVARVRLAFVSGLAVCFFAAVPLAAEADPGDLDPTFGAAGKVVTPIGTFVDVARDVAVQSDGKIIAAGSCWSETSYDFCLARYNGEGTLDPTFDSDGTVITPIGTGNDNGWETAVQTDGKIVVAGNCGTASADDFCLARYTPEGSLDTSFDDDGKVTTDIAGSEDVGTAMAIQADGRIVVAGLCSFGFTEDVALCLARYESDGSLDTSFDTDGKVTTPSSRAAVAMALQSDGKIVVAGACLIGATLSGDFCLARYSHDGSLDTSFDDDGGLGTSFGGGFSAAEAVAVRSDGKLVAAGKAFYIGHSHISVARFNGDGSLDNSFDDDGKVETGIQALQADDVAAQSDGKVVVAGTCGANFCLLRFNDDGSFDISFDDDGVVTTSFGPSVESHLGAIAVQSDGKIVAGGYCSPTGLNFNYDFCLARYDEVTPGAFGLVVAKTGTGFGRVTAPGIDCGTDCFAHYVPGTEVTLTAAAGAGSVFGSWSGCDSSAGASCTVTVSSSRTVTASFTATPTFVDVPPSNPFYEDIEELFDLGITTGCGTDGSGSLLFCPGDPMPRQQLAAFLVRAKGLSQLNPATPTFADVPQTDPFYGHIERAYEQGLLSSCGTNGSGELLFCPGAFVLRQRIAEVLVRATGGTELFSPSPTFVDVPASNPFYGWIERLAQQGITTGCVTDGVGQRFYCPTENVPRQQMAAFLIRAFAP